MQEHHPQKLVVRLRSQDTHQLCPFCTAANKHSLTHDDLTLTELTLIADEGVVLHQYLRSVCHPNCALHGSCKGDGRCA